MIENFTQEDIQEIDSEEAMDVVLEHKLRDIAQGLGIEPREEIIDKILSYSKSFHQ